MFFYSGAKLWKHFKIPKFPKKIFYLCVIFCISCYKRIRFTEIGDRRSEVGGRKSEVGGRRSEVGTLEVGRSAVGRFEVGGRSPEGRT